jgi:type IV secretion system protein VirB9
MNHKKGLSAVFLRLLSVFLLASAPSLLFLSCRTVHFDGKPESEALDGGYESAAEWEEGERERWKAVAIEEELKELDVEATVIYVDRPVYSPDPLPEEEEAGKGAAPPLTGAAAVLASESSARQVPMKYQGGIMSYPFDESFTYEIHTRPYRVTDIILEPGETVLEQPIMSENNVWEVAAGVSRSKGWDVQHFFLKPSKGNLATDMVIITDRRVYHLHLKSFYDRHMVMVKWEYPYSSFGPLALPSLKTTDAALGAASYSREEGLVNPAFLSFDYKMKYSIFRKPAWLPCRVYDDGAKTYIEMNEEVLHSASPALFNGKDERINYRVKGNLIIIDELIQKVTLKIAKESVSIEKKKAR